MVDREHFFLREPLVGEIDDLVVRLELRDDLRHRALDGRVWSHEVIGEEDSDAWSWARDQVGLPWDGQTIGVVLPGLALVDVDVHVVFQLFY